MFPKIFYLPPEVFRPDYRRILFVAENCPYCAMARQAIFDIRATVYIPPSKRIHFKNVDLSPSAKEELRGIDRGLGKTSIGTPLLYFEGICKEGALTRDSYREGLMELLKGG